MLRVINACLGTASSLRDSQKKEYLLIGLRLRSALDYWKLSEVETGYLVTISPQIP